MNREEIIKYSLIVLLAVLIIFILMRVLNLGNIKSLFVKETFEVNKNGPVNGPVRESSGNRDVPLPAVASPKLDTASNIPVDNSSEISGFDDSDFANVLADVSSSENGPSVNFKACDLNKVSPEELLPSGNTEFANLNPVLDGGLKNKNFLEAGAHIGLDTIGQSLRNANYQLRADPPNPKMNVGPWNNTTIEADPSRRPLE